MQKDKKNSAQARKSPVSSLPKSMTSLVHELRNHIATLRVGITGLLAILVVSLYWNVTAIDRLVVHIPPDLSNGAVMKSGDVPKSSVFVNTAYLWLEFNTWMKDGSKESFDNLFSYQAYFSPKFIDVMRQEYEFKNKRNELNRQRRLTLVPGTSAEAMKRVIPITKNSWVVYLDVVDEEFYLGERVKNSLIRYSLLVETVEANMDRNPIGMRIVGFKEQPKLLKEM